MADNRPVQRSPGQQLAYQLGFERGRRQSERVQRRRRREVIETKDSITTIEEEIIVEERYW